MAGLVGLLRQLGDLAESVFFVSCSLIYSFWFWVISLSVWFRLAELVVNLEKDRKIFEVFAGWV
jgi:hypothetical protein